MVKVVFQRVDIAVTLKRTEDGGARARVSTSRAGMETRLSSKTVQGWLDSGPGASLPQLAEFLSLTADSPTWQEWREVADTPESQPAARLSRLTFDVADLELAALAWEQSLRLHIPAHQFPAVVRVSPIVPRVTSIPLTLPIRFLQIDPSPHRTLLREKIRRVFDSHPDELVSQAVQIETCSFSGLEAFRAQAKWPTAEVLHFDHLSGLEAPESILSTADPEQPGTLGWLARLADTWQTRLIVIHCDSLNQAAQARRLATALVNRGGPGVLAGYFPTGEAERFYGKFYGNLIHDTPLDANFSTAGAGESTLLVGTGRSEALRVSSVAEGLIRLAREFDIPKTAGPQVARLEIREMLERLELNRPQATRDSAAALRQFQSYLSDLSNDLDKLQFQFHEGQGLLPLTSTLGRVRTMVGWQPPAGPAEQVAPTPVPPGPRYVNSHLWRRSNDELTRLDQKEARLFVGEIYHLGVQMGLQDQYTRVSGAVALLEEIFKWTQAVKGVWLEVGLTGLDFEVLGSPVQEIWLPRGSDSETIYFAVVPKTSQVARLRFCVYHKSDLIQSFRLAALTGTTKDPDVPIEVRTDRLARALDLPTQAVGDVGYLARLEYSVTARLEGAPDRPSRAVSIVANELDRQSVITVKGPDLFEVRVNADLPDRIEWIRRALEGIATPPIDGVDPDGWLYGFGYDNNAGNVATLKNALTRLATLGWELYDGIVREKGRPALTGSLRPEKQIIHVAHILLNKVIPWATVYDRKYDPQRELDDNLRPVAHDVCLAALPDTAGKLPVAECGLHPNCLLHSDRLEERRAQGEPALLRETVVCPLHFWGFKHIIELPPQQTAPAPAIRQPGATPSGREQLSCILAGRPAQMTAGIHARVPRAQPHAQELDSLVKEPNINAAWKSRASHRDVILKNLQDTGLDIIYLYCHASDKHPVQGEVEPYLEFQDQNQLQPRTINAAALAYDQLWSHHPLVFLNGCRTAGFSPRALSPFIIKLVEGRGAAGVIGTEISVWEPLAGELALHFLRQFLQGRSAGEALLTARRALLAKYNPLGLVYTLYAAANLKLDLDGDGKCLPD